MLKSIWKETNFHRLRFRGDEPRTRVEWAQASTLVKTALYISGLFSIVFDCILAVFIRLCGNNDRYRTAVIEWFQVIMAVSAMCMLIWIGKITTSRSGIIIFYNEYFNNCLFWTAEILLFMRVADLINTSLVLIILRSPPKQPARSIILIIFHYFELSVIFALAYCLFDSVLKTGSSCLIFENLKLNSILSREATHYLYFSLVTGATIGYGDIHVSLSNECTLERYVVIFQPLAFLFLTAVELPRIINSLKPQKQDRRTLLWRPRIY
jgi:Ion channel